ncbi:uncharacterized protein LOC115673037 isoform X1 [Syzygium oleosum]|uniref:uncharacterized protein LOC115673037 isoform X1 n=1 Tax=Syzygium oleosum TaxID=219896 RepID=UPI0011D22FF1|nr:uncharacterized protein LOC115673037 isoform X1 [Syzygium oleosum]XP_056164245.1 uncharacterized protein LOC115673037 isoform X1 [Syzygium oleosum]
MTDFQPLQQKPESTGDVCSEFERGLEELMRGHLDDCMSFASCSSTRTPDEEDDEGDQLVRRRRRSELEGDDLAESSAARRRHSRILSRWAARQAQEMITTIERRNRESELMALAGLQTVSMLDASFLRESQSPTSLRQGAAEQPNTRASSILQMWRELEDEQLLSRARERVRERLRQRRSVEPNTNLSSTNMSESRGTEIQGSVGDVSESENEYGTWSHDQTQNEPRDDNGSSREQSPDLGEVERERVRQIVRGWMESGIGDHSSNGNHRDNRSRAEWLGETERERVRIVREWVQMASQRRDARGSRREEQEEGARQGTQGDGVREGSVADTEDGQPEHIRRDMLRLRGRQALIDLLMRVERERQRELQNLVEHRAVSDFAHRNRIQSLLRGRFLRNERTVEEERPPSMAASELVQLRQRHTVSGLREGFRSRLETIVRGQANTQSDSASVDVDDESRNVRTPGTSLDGQQETHEPLQSTSQANDSNRSLDRARNNENNAGAEGVNWQDTSNESGNWEQNLAGERGEGQQQTAAQFNEFRDDNIADMEFRDDNIADMDGNWPTNSANDWAREAPTNLGEQYLQQTQGIWHDVGGPHEAVGMWPEGSSGPSRARRAGPLRRYNRFHPPDDDNVYSMELRELLSRRSVSNLLRSGFRESLDQLIQSYVERQGRAPIEWDLQRNLPAPTPTPASPSQDQELQTDQADVTNRPPRVLPGPSIPAPQPLWHQDLHHTGWSRHSMHRPEIEWEMINDLRTDMSRLQQGMSHMQRMLEACMDMQLELQRSVRQEVSAALNRFAGDKGLGPETSEDGSRWAHVRKGTCCVCCDSHIDSLLYRCGHMCTCLKCANELVRGGGKCPLCRAPIVEVVRAYSIL